MNEIYCMSAGVYKLRAIVEMCAPRKCTDKGDIVDSE